MFGLIPEIHKPQVWVERTDAQRAKPILDDYERRAAELRDARTQDEMQAEPALEIVCQECGKHSAFPASQRGSVQQCQHCDAYIDVEDEESLDEPAEFQSDEDEARDP
jgi:hypothetical protein